MDAVTSRELATSALRFARVALRDAATSDSDVATSLVQARTSVLGAVTLTPEHFTAHGMDQANEAVRAIDAARLAFDSGATATGDTAVVDARRSLRYLRLRRSDARIAEQARLLAGPKHRAPDVLESAVPATTTPKHRAPLVWEMSAPVPYVGKHRSDAPVDSAPLVSAVAGPKHRAAGPVDESPVPTAAPRHRAPLASDPIAEVPAATPTPRPEPTPEPTPEPAPETVAIPTPTEIPVPENTPHLTLVPPIDERVATVSTSSEPVYVPIPSAPLRPGELRPEIGGSGPRAGDVVSAAARAKIAVAGVPRTAAGADPREVVAELMAVATLGGGDAVRERVADVSSVVRLLQLREKGIETAMYVSRGIGDVGTPEHRRQQVAAIQVVDEVIAERVRQLSS